MARFKLTRNIEAEDKELFQVKLPKSLITDLNLMVTWAKRERTDVVTEMLRFALTQEADFQRERKRANANIPGGVPDASQKKEVASEKGHVAAAASK